MNKSVFDVFDNADDEMIEKLSSFTDDDDEVKKRIFDMSERKFKNLTEGLSENETNSKDEITMNVTNKRPVRWFKPIAAAVAVFAVVAGVTKVTSELDKYKAPSDEVLPAAQTATTSPVQSESVTEQQSALTEDQMKELYDIFCDFYYDLFDNLVSRQYTVDNEGHYVIKNPDNYVDVQDKDHYEINNFYECSDVRFGTLDEFNDYYSCFFDGTGIKFNAGKKYDKLDGEKLLFADETIDEYYRNGWLDDMLFECDNKLYLNEDIVRDYHYGPSHIKDYFSERSFYVTENSFTRIRLFKDDNCSNPYGRPMIYGLSVTFNKDDDGMWSIGKVSSPNSYVSDYVELFGDFSEISDTNCYQMLFDVYPYPNDLPYVSKPWNDDSQSTEVFTSFTEEKPFEEYITSVGEKPSEEEMTYVGEKPSEEEMKEIFGRFIDYYSDISDMITDSDNVRHPEDFVMINKNDMEHQIDSYYLLTDERFSSIEEYNRYCSRYFKGTNFEFNAGRKFERFDEKNNENVIFIDSSERETLGFKDYSIIEVNGKLYISTSVVPYYRDWPSELVKNYFSERSFNVSGNEFFRVRLSRAENHISAIGAIFRKNAEGKWSYDGLGFCELYEDVIDGMGKDLATISDTDCYRHMFPQYSDEIF